MAERLFLGLLTPSEILAILTAALVIVTMYYAWQTRRMVAEMERARAIAILPRIAVSIVPIGGGVVGWVRLTNVGPGPAVGVQATIKLEPNGFEIPWQAHVVAPNESHDFVPQSPDDPEAQLGYLDQLTDRFDRVSLDATYRDALGGTHATHESIEIRQWWQSLKVAGHLVMHDRPAEAVAELEKIRKALDKVASEAEKAGRQRDGLVGRWRWERRVRKLPEALQPTARRALRAAGLLR